MLKNDENKPASKNIILLGIVSFLNDLSSEMILPILPLLIAQVGGTGIAIGIIGGIRDSGAETLKALFGYLSDRLRKRKFFIYVGYLTSAFFKLLLIFAHSWPFIFLLVGLERIGKAIRTAPRNALIAQSTPMTIGKGFGIHQAFDSLGAIFGSIATFFLIWQWHCGFTTIILIAAIISFTSILPLGNVQEISLKQTILTQQFSVFQLPQSFKIFTAIASVFSLGHVSYMFLILQAQNNVLFSSPIAASILLYVLFNVFYSACCTPFGILSDKIGRWKMIVTGYLIFALTMASFFIATNTATLMLSFILYGITLAIIQVNHRAFAADLSPQHIKATALGIFEATTGLITFVSGIVTGLIWEFIQHDLIFIYGGVIALCAVCLLLIFKNRINPQPIVLP